MTRERASTEVIDEAIARASYRDHEPPTREQILADEVVALREDLKEEQRKHEYTRKQELAAQQELRRNQQQLGVMQLGKTEITRHRDDCYQDIERAKVRIAELEQECDLLIWENQQATQALTVADLSHLTPEQKRQLIKDVEGANQRIAGRVVVEPDDTLSAKLKQALAVIHDQRASERATNAQNLRLLKVLAKLHMNFSWVQGVLRGALDPAVTLMPEDTTLPPHLRPMEDVVPAGNPKSGRWDGLG